MRLRVYATLRDLVGSSFIEVNVPQTTDVRDVLHQAALTHPELAAKLWDEQGQLSRSMQLLVNGRSIQFLQGLDTPVQPGDTLNLFPPVGGG